MQLKPVFVAVALILILILAFTTESHAQDWPQWRGENRDGVATGSAVPTAWPDELSIRWKRDVGIGYASPVVVGGRVFLFSREGGDEVIRSLSLDDGEALWRQSYPAPYEMNPYTTDHGEGPKATPLVSGDKLYTLGITGIVSCYRADTGALVWRKSFQEGFSKPPLYGFAASPIVADGKLIVHVGGEERGILMALAPDSGSVVWSLEGDGPGYASPIVIDLEETRQIVTLSESRILGVSLDAGELLWSLPFITTHNQNIVTPIQQGRRLIFSGLGQPTFAIELTRGSEGWSTRELWRNEAVSFYMSSPVIASDRLIGMSHQQKGQFVALDPDTGELLWSSKGRMGDNAAFVVVGDDILILDAAAELAVVPIAANTFEPKRRYTVADTETWAHPVPTSEGILIKDLESLALWR